VIRSVDQKWLVILGSRLLFSRVPISFKKKIRFTVVALDRCSALSARRSGTKVPLVILEHPVRVGLRVRVRVKGLDLGLGLGLGFGVRKVGKTLAQKFGVGKTLAHDRRTTGVP
jgi:hypothetical protein